MKFRLFFPLLASSLLMAHEKAPDFQLTRVSITPQVPQWAPSVTDDGTNDTLPPCLIELEAKLVPATTQLEEDPEIEEEEESTPQPPKKQLCNIFFRGRLTDGKEFSASNPSIYHEGGNVVLSFESKRIPTATELSIKGTLSYELRSGEETEMSTPAIIKGRGEYKTDGYIIHYLPDAGEGTHEHTFMVMPPDRISASAAIIVGVVFTDAEGTVWSTKNGKLKREEVWYAEDAVCFTTDAKAPTDKGKLQIILQGKAEKHQSVVEQKISLTPAKQ